MRLVAPIPARRCPGRWVGHHCTAIAADGSNCNSREKSSPMPVEHAALSREPVTRRGEVVAGWLSTGRNPLPAWCRAPSVISAWPPTPTDAVISSADSRLLRRSVAMLSSYHVDYAANDARTAAGAVESNGWHPPLENLSGPGHLLTDGDAPAPGATPGRSRAGGLSGYLCAAYPAGPSAAMLGTFDSGRGPRGSLFSFKL